MTGKENITRLRECIFRITIDLTIDQVIPPLPPYQYYAALYTRVASAELTSLTCSLHVSKPTKYCSAG